VDYLSPISFSPFQNSASPTFTDQRKQSKISWEVYGHTHTHTHTQREREREREGSYLNAFSQVAFELVVSGVGGRELVQHRLPLGCSVV